MESIPEIMDFTEPNNLCVSVQIRGQSFCWKAYCDFSSIYSLLKIFHLMSFVGNPRQYLLLCLFVHLGAPSASWCNDLCYV